MTMIDRQVYPDNYEFFEYNILNKQTWAIKDENGEIWFPVTHLIQHAFGLSYFRLSHLNEKQNANTIRVRLLIPGKIGNKPAPVVFCNKWCITNIIRSKLKLHKNYKTRHRDVLVEEFARIWDINIIGFGVITHRQPNWSQYPLIDKIAIAAENNKTYWMRCVECEKYYPHTFRFFKESNVTCEKCLNQSFGICADGAYERINEMLKKGIDK